MAGAGLARIESGGRLAWANPAFCVFFPAASTTVQPGSPHPGSPTPTLKPTLHELLSDAAPGDAADRLIAGQSVRVTRRGGEAATLVPAVGEGGDLCLTLLDARTPDGGGAGGLCAGLPDGPALVETVLDAMSDAVSAFDAGGGLIVWNRRYLEVFRLPPDLVTTGRPLEDLIRFTVERGDYGPGDRASILAERLALCRNPAPSAYRMTRADGSILDVRRSPLPGGGFLGVYTDVTDRARADEAQIQIMQAISFPLVVTRQSDGLVLTANQHAGDLFEVPVSDAIGRLNAYDHYSDPEERDRLVEAMRTGGGRVDGFETRMRTVAGRDLWVILSARLFRYQGENAMLACVNDISARKRVEQALAAQWTQTSAVLNGLSQGVLAFDRDLRLTAWNQRALELLGIEPGSLHFHRPCEEIVRAVAARGGYGKGDVEELTAAQMALLRAADRDLRRERVRVDGVVIECHNQPLPDGGLVSTYTDITERRQAERELAASRELFELAIRAAREGISQWDLRTGALWFSPQWWGLLGYGEEEMDNSLERWSELVLPEDRERSLKLAEDLAEGLIDQCQLVQRFRHKDGRVVHLHTRAIRVLGADGRAIRLVGAHTDVTERIRAEEQIRAAKEEAERALRDLKDAQAHLIQSEKMAALGSLVAGVAHEINTPVGIALTGSSLLSERLRLIRRDFEAGRLRKPDFADFLDTAAEATQLMLLNIDRAAQLIQSFKQIAVDQASEERRAFDLRDYLHEVLRSLGVRIKRAAHTVVVDCPEDLMVDGYPGALSQVLTNFVMNSIIHGYGPGERGTLRVTVTPVGDDEVELVYADDGRGIPPEVQNKVFDPFFTTNRGSGGSGLGLNIVYNIATRTLKGRIALDSAPGRGTTFTLRFPRVAPAELALA